MLWLSWETLKCLKKVKSTHGPSTQSCYVALITPWGCLDQGLSRTQWTGTCVVGDLVRGPAVPRVDLAWAGGGQGGRAEARHGPKLLTLWTPMGSAVPLPSHVTLSMKEANPT